MIEDGKTTRRWRRERQYSVGSQPRARAAAAITSWARCRCRPAFIAPGSPACSGLVRGSHFTWSSRRTWTWICRPCVAAVRATHG